MSEIGEAIGTAGEGALLAHAVGGAKTATDGHFAEASCLNCGTALVGPHCHACGQKAHLHRTLGAFLHDLLHGAFHFEGKIWRTLPMLAFKPGQLTRRYIEGERTRFVSPMALFLFAIFLMFAVFQALGFSPPSTFSTASTVQTGLDQARTDAQVAHDRAVRELAEMRPNDPARAATEAELAATQEDIAGLEKLGKLEFSTDDINLENANITGIDAIDEGVIRKWKANPGLMLYKLQANSYKFSWMLIPISIPFVWLLFAWKRRFGAYDHAIFVTYSLAFMSLLFLALSVLGKAGVPVVGLLAAGTLIPLAHIYKQLRGAYDLSRGSALWRLGALLFFMMFIVLIFLELLIILGAF